MKNDTTFVCMRSGDHLGDTKMSKKAPHSVEFNFLMNCDRQKRFSQSESRRADLQILTSDLLIFAPGLRVCRRSLQKLPKQRAFVFFFWGGGEEGRGLNRLRKASFKQKGKMSCTSVDNAHCAPPGPAANWWELNRGSSFCPLPVPPPLKNKVNTGVSDYLLLVEYIWIICDTVVLTWQYNFSFQTLPFSFFCVVCDFPFFYSLQFRNNSVLSGQFLFAKLWKIEVSTPFPQ